ncbi:MAG: sigma-54 dependent transcriptional regulator [bacterium]
MPTSDAAPDEKEYQPRILLADDDPQLLEAIGTLLASHGYDVVSARDGEEALESFGRGPYDLLLTDVIMPRMDGLALIKEVKARDAEMPVIILTAHGSIEMAVTAMKLGATDYLTKPFAAQELMLRIERAMRERKLSSEIRSLRKRMAGRMRKSDIIIGVSPGMREVVQKVGMVTKSDVSVIVYGESGTGKEIVARTIHKYSNRADKPFVTVNCAALPEALLENELFGHVKGAYTGAHTNQKGLFEEAEGGTLFLDEIGEIPPSIQVKLLQVLQSYEFKRVGGTKTIKVDVRTLFATNKDLAKSLKDGTFREDLFYRINVVPIVIPPLRERKDDIPLLVNHFLELFTEELGKKVEGYTADAMKRLMTYDWPGNVRQLQNKIKQSIVTTTHRLVTPEDIWLDVVETPVRDVDVSRPYADLKREMVDDFERVYLGKLLAGCAGNLSEAARRSGMHRKNLYVLMKKHGLPSGV